MQIEHVAIRNFRGVRDLDWHVGGRTVCLIGPGNSTKTTILDAIELTLLPTWNPTIMSSDFYGLNVDGGLSIEVSVSELPDTLVDDQKFGLLVRGYKSNVPVLEDPDDDSKPVLTVRFEVGSDFEPRWHVVKGNERKQISQVDRSHLGLARLGDDYRQDVTWGYASALTRMTEQNVTRSALRAAAGRAASMAVDAAMLEGLQPATQVAQAALTGFGVPCANLRPGVDPHAIKATTSLLALHDEDIPLRMSGLGSLRLASLAIQRQSVIKKGIILIDEVEYGLEPHRIRQLLRRMSPGGGDSIGQVIVTTHSPTPIVHLSVEDLRFVRSQAGTTTVHCGSSDIQGMIRRYNRKLWMAF